MASSAESGWLIAILSNLDKKDREQLLEWFSVVQPAIMTSAGLDTDWLDDLLTEAEGGE